MESFSALKVFWDKYIEPPMNSILTDFTTIHDLYGLVGASAEEGLLDINTTI